jgi:hypothetical protein
MLKYNIRKRKHWVHPLSCDNLNCCAYSITTSDQWICRTDKCLHIGRWTDRNWVKSATGCYNIILWCAYFISKEPGSRLWHALVASILGVPWALHCCHITTFPYHHLLLPFHLTHFWNKSWILCRISFSGCTTESRTRWLPYLHANKTKWSQKQLNDLDMNKVSVKGSD